MVAKVQFGRFPPPLRWLGPCSALTLGLVGQPLLWWQASDQVAGLRAPDALGAVLVLLATVPLALLSRRPVVTLAVTSAAFFAYSALGYAASPGDLGPLVALGWVVAFCGPGVGWVSTGLVSGAMVVAALVRPGDHQLSRMLVDGVVAPAAALVGLVVRVRRAQNDLGRREQTLECEQLDLAAQQVASAERLYIARELHDAVGHGLTLTALRAEAAALLLDSEPGRARQLLVEVAQTGRSALLELHSMLAVLREDVAGADGRAEVVACREEVQEVLQRFSGPDLDIDLQVSGASRVLGDVLDVTVAAIVAEGLSNIARHAQTAQGTVRLCFGETSLVVEVADDGPGPPERIATGFGLKGAVERATAVGGELAFGPNPGGGALLRAVLPYVRTPPR